MARKLRLDEAGGRYHVLNRGNYRQGIFESEGAKQAFETTLLEACERAGWVLHAYCIMSNHYHLALETPQGHLSEGMRWLQGTFATRFNRYRRESGHLFQGRFKSLEVEDATRLAWLCHYIHLNPVRAGLVPEEGLASYRWSSLWHLGEAERRPKVLNLNAALLGAGELADTPAGRRAYMEYLRWLQTDEPTRREMAFEQMSRGWAIGSREFCEAVVADERALRAVAQLTHEEGRQAREAAWAEALGRCLRELKIEPAECLAGRKSEAWKVGVATYLRHKRLATNAWLAEKLAMGHPCGVSRYTHETLRGDRPAAREIYDRLCARIKH